MKEEEKKAIELLEDIKNNTWTTKYIMSSDSKNAKVLLNLIEKLQKENEELRAKWDKDTHILQNELDLTNADKINNYIPVQEVKDKIEEEKIPLTIVGGRKNKKTLEYGIKLGRRHVLQELLEGRK